MALNFLAAKAKREARLVVSFLMGINIFANLLDRGRVEDSEGIRQLQKRHLIQEHVHLEVRYGPVFALPKNCEHNQ